MTKKKVNGPRIIHVSGKRRRSIARATVKEGSGIVRINSVPLSIYGNDYLRMRLEEPIILAGDNALKIDINVKVNGGGYQSQNEAARLTISRGIINYFDDEELKKRFLAYDRYLLIADDRQTEPHKPCRSSARRGKQTSKR